ncbi:coiled-coil protein isoform X2 [Wolffia australiana]
MPGKGKRRRERNFRAAHGGESRLPPPPDPRAVDAIPSKLRRLMQFMNGAPTIPGSSGSVKGDRSPPAEQSNRKKVVEKVSIENKENPSGTENPVSSEKKKRKREKKVAKDLRFLDLEQTVGQRKQKRMEYLKTRKNKTKRANDDEDSEFPKKEQVKFGEVVHAPPKLTLPKVPRNGLDASVERRRLQAVEAYRNMKGWESRPGIRLPTL